MPSNLTNNTYLNNSAFYGPDIASYPINLIRIDSHNMTLDDEPIENVASGLPANYTIRMELLDHYGQRVMSDSVSEITLVSDNSNATIREAQTSTCSKGVCELNANEWQVIGWPITTVPIKINTNATDGRDVEKANDGYKSYNSSKEILVDLRACGIGEITDGNVCKVCEATQYSLDGSLLE